MRVPVIAASAILASLLLLSPAVAVAGQSAAGAAESGWRTLTKQNFSAEIRRHPHLLVMVTVPWSGESRSLMTEVSRLLFDKQEQLNHLKLRVVYRNNEKLLADILGAVEGISFFFYHHSTSYKYQGKFHAQNILSSIHQFMSLKSEEVPMKPIHTQDDLENFFQSTDKAIILVDLCGWSDKLLYRRNSENNEILLPVQNQSDYDSFSIAAGALGEKLTREADRTVQIDNGSQKGFETEDDTCEIDDEFFGSSWIGRFTSANQSASQEAENQSAGSGVSCTLEKFHQFESFFSKFTTIAREYYLPLERQKYGLISEGYLLSLLGIDVPDTWSLMIHFSGCLNCSIVLQEGDDLRAFLLTEDPLVMELEANGNNLEPAFPANRPSIILFIDRSSISSEVARESKSSLEVLRKFAQQNQLSYQMANGLDDHSPENFSTETDFGTPGRSAPHLAGRQNVRNFPASKVKAKNKIALASKGEKTIPEYAATDTQGNPVYDIIAQLLHHKQHAIKTKEMKISLLAKKVGFQLLSDDFDVEVIDSSSSNQFADSLPPIVENDQPNEMVTGVAMPPEVQTFDVPEEAVEQNVKMESDDFLNTVIVQNDENQPELLNMETGPQQKLETIALSEGITSTYTKEEKGGLSALKHTQLNNEDSIQVESQFNIEHIEQESTVHSDCSLNKACSLDVQRSLTNGHSSLASVQNDDTGINSPMIAGKLGEIDTQLDPFLGSFFFSDGGYRLLSMLTAGSSIPSLVILDPILQQHYAMPKETSISYSSLVDFVKKFLSRSLTPYRQSANAIVNPRETPRPPFVNLDFREADAIPRVTANTFCEMVVGYKHCELGDQQLFSHIQSFGSAWETDVLVLFGSSWCGFCQRMELILREAYRAFKNFRNTLEIQSMNMDHAYTQDQNEDTMIDKFPSILLMDCVHNDCDSFLQQVGKKVVYPTLLLFPAANKSAISYEGGASVVNVIDFFVSHGRNSEYLNRHKGFLWTRDSKGSTSKITLNSSLPVDEKLQYAEDEHNEFILGTAIRQDHHVGSQKSVRFHDDGQYVYIGTVLAATEKLTDAFPFNNSTILIVNVDQNEGIQGVIINKRISWDIFKELKEELQPLKRAPLFYGGPVRVHNSPLVSLARKPMEGFIKVRAGLHFGNQVATSMVIEWIRLGERSADDYWFFLGYSSWEWNQLSNELEEGAWLLNNSPVKLVHWPDN